MSASFQAAFIGLLTTGLNNPNVTIAWAQLPAGAPVLGKTDVVLFNAPGGERENTHSGMSGEMMRRIQVSIFSVDPQDVADVGEACHTILDGYRGTLTDGTVIGNIVPGMQDIDSWDNQEKVHQRVFDVQVRMQG